MSIRIANERPVIEWCNGDFNFDIVIGTSLEWDWLFRDLREANKTISQIKLIRQFNPGMGLKDAKDAFEAIDAWRRNRS